MNVIHAQHKFQGTHKAQAVASGDKPSYCVPAEPVSPSALYLMIFRLKHWWWRITCGDEYERWSKGE